MPLYEVALRFVATFVIAVGMFIPAAAIAVILYKIEQFRKRGIKKKCL